MIDIEVAPADQRARVCQFNFSERDLATISMWYVIRPADRGFGNAVTGVERLA